VVWARKILKEGDQEGTAIKITFENGLSHGRLGEVQRKVRLFLRGRGEKLGFRDSERTI